MKRNYVDEAGSEWPTERKLTHTPTPWVLSDNDPTVIVGFKKSMNYTAVIAETSGYEEKRIADAAYIVRAVNSHEELLEAAKEMRDELKKHGIGALTWDRRIEKAEGK